MRNIGEIDKNIVSILKNGGVGVIPTDTLYGLVGSALDEKAVERIYKLRKRHLKKPMIVLISDKKDLKLFGITLNKVEKDFLEAIWPDKISVILSCEDEKFAYLHRGKKSLAFRVPEKEWLRQLLRKTGPLVAPSANFEGESAAVTIEEAKKYFAEKIDFYVDLGKMKSKPSTLLKFENGELEVIREGAVKILC